MRAEQYTQSLNRDGYTQNIEMAADTLTVLGVGELVYKTQWESGSTLWGTEDQTFTMVVKRYGFIDEVNSAKMRAYKVQRDAVVSTQGAKS